MIIALVGNPNVGKSTLFNGLTGLNQHTGNWPGKTVSIAQGRYTYKGKGYILVDLPGTYSLICQSEEERVAVEFILSGQADCTLVLGDATCLERNLNLILQVMEITDRVVLCVNLLDEAKRRKVDIDLMGLERLLGVPVVGTAAGAGQGFSDLQEKIRNLCDGFISCSPHRTLPAGTDFLCDLCQDDSDKIAVCLNNRAAEIADLTVLCEKGKREQFFDRIALGRWSGRVLLLGLLFLVFWITIQGANYPSQLLQSAFDWIAVQLRFYCSPIPLWLQSLLIDGIYTTVARVVAVMLPPMAIFFPLFTLLEDLGYLPRAAFLMDRSFQRCGGCGKQVLTMAMGFGCNAVGVMGCRIISSPRERLLAILTNAMVPCNGRFPAMIVLISLFFTDHSLLGALILTGFVLLSVIMTFLSSGLLNHTLLKGRESHFILELPPYRRPQFGKILVRSILDRTVFVLVRAICVAAPTGLLIWVLQRVMISDMSLLQWAANRLEPLGAFLGMNGVVLLAFILSFPANELLLPLTMLILQGGVLQETSMPLMGQILTDAGWTCQTAICVLLFLLFHWPCGTTCLTIRKETGSLGWTAAAILLPTTIGILLCHVVSIF